MIRHLRVLGLAVVAVSGTAWGAAPAVSTNKSVATAAPAEVKPVQPAVVIAPAPASDIIRVGTPIALKLSEELTTKEKQVHVGQRFNLEVAEALQVGDQVVIPVGTPAIGEVTEVRNKGMWGKSGHIAAHVLYLRVGSRQIRLTGTFDEKGTTGTAGVVTSVALVPLAGFFVTGTSAHLPLGMPVKAFIDEDVPLAIDAKPGATPISVPATH